jgi:hypothetical protein
MGRFSGESGIGVVVRASGGHVPRVWVGTAAGVDLPVVSGMGGELCAGRSDTSDSGNCAANRR